MTHHPWTDREIEAARRVLAKHDDIGDALEEISATVRRCNYDALRGAFRSRELGTLREYLARPGETGRRHLRESVDVSSRDTERPEPPAAEPSPVQPVDGGTLKEEIERVAAAVARRPLALVAVCDAIDEKPSRVRELIEVAAARGYALKLADGWVSLGRNIRTERTGDLDGGKPKPGHHFVTVVSDIHFGSEHCAAEELANFIEYAHSMGSRTTLIPGDILDGFKDFLVHEQRAIGFEHQAEEAVRYLPRLDGHVYATIGGNHDGYYSGNGLEPGRALASVFRDHGRDDWYHLGACKGRVRVAGANWLLYHCSGGAGTNPGALAAVEKEVDAIPTGSADFVVMGHLHKCASSWYRGAFPISCGTWQRKESEFGNRIPKEWAVGGQIVQYDVDDDGEVIGKGFRFFEARHFKRPRRAA